MKKVFSYLDYRQFLKERFTAFQKARRWTHRSLAEKAGFSSPNFLKLVMEGHRNLSKRSIAQVAAAFELRDREAEFFAALVLFNQAKDLEKKDSGYEQLKTLRHDLKLQRLEPSQFDYFNHWYSVAIREMLGLRGFREDPKWISAKFGHQITPAQARRSLRLLEDLGLICRNASGQLVSRQNPVTSGDEVSSLAAYRFHRTMIEKANEALRSSPAEQRDISSVTLAATRNTAAQIKRKIQRFRKEILAMAEDDGKAETVYQMNIQFFNLLEPA